MKTGLLLSTAGLMIISGTTAALAACTSAPSCSALGYSMSAADCPDGGVKCPFDTSKYFCYSSCAYTKTASSCASECKNVGIKSCTRNGTTYYESCGSSKCSSSQTCSSGTCVSSSSSCSPSSSNYCAVHGTCHGNCCTDGTIEPCDTRCGGSGCSSGGSGDESCGTLKWSISCCYSGECNYSACISMGVKDCSYYSDMCTKEGGKPSVGGCYAAGDAQLDCRSSQ